MDVLLAGKRALPLFERIACQVMSSDVRQFFYSGLMSNTIPGSVENCSASDRNRCSASRRNPVRLQTGIVFAFTPESCSDWSGIASLPTGGHGSFSCHAAFLHPIDTMFNRHAKWLKVTSGIPVKTSLRYPAAVRAGVPRGA
jgi:hypothetical protein